MTDTPPPPYRGEYSDEHYDIVTWNPAHEEWIPRNYLLTRNTVKTVLERKRQSQPSFVHQAVRVETTVQYVDITDELDNEETNP